MSNPNLPQLTPRIALTRDDAINMLLSSIAMEELALAHILNAEGEKIQYALGTSMAVSAPGNALTVEDLLAANNSVEQTLNTTNNQQIMLHAKMRRALRSARGK
jgi:hypothetical protein